MDLPAKEWHEAIFVRHSRRRYTGERPGTDALRRLERVATEFRPFPGARAVLIDRSPDEVFRGLIGSYGQVKGAPLYAAFIGDMADPNVQEAVGYTGEGFVLEATSLGLATCWVGGFFRPEAVLGHIELAFGEKVLAVTPIGYAPEGKTFEEKTMSGFAEGHRRKAVTALCAGAQPAAGSWVEAAVNAARLAPSAVNRQPWRFIVTPDSVTVTLDDSGGGYGISKRLDCGIAMLHLELGALAAGHRGSWELLAPPRVARYA